MTLWFQHGWRTGTQTKEAFHSVFWRFHFPSMSICRGREPWLFLSRFHVFSCNPYRYWINLCGSWLYLWLLFDFCTTYSHHSHELIHQIFEFINQSLRQTCSSHFLFCFHFPYQFLSNLLCFSSSTSSTILFITHHHDAMERPLVGFCIEFISFGALHWSAHFCRVVIGCRGYCHDNVLQCLGPQAPCCVCGWKKDT